MKSLPVVILLSLLLSACQYSSRVQTVLDKADRQVFTEPDSAVTLLDSLDLSSASTAQRARHALLLTKAHTKAHIDFTNDSLIYTASDYYRGKGDSLEVQSLYYYGSTLNHEKRYSEALVTLEEALEKAKDNDDNFYTAMACRKIAGIYNEGLAFAKAKEYSKKSAYYFDLSHKPLHAAWERINLAYYDAKLNNNDSAMAMLSRIKEYSLSGIDPKLAIEWHRVHALSNIELGLYNEAYEEMQHIATVCSELSLYDYFLTGTALCGLGRYDEALRYRDNIRRSKSTLSDSLSDNYLSYMIDRSSGDSLSAYKYFHKYQAQSTPNITKLLTYSYQDSLTEHYIYKANGINRIFTKERRIYGLVISLEDNLTELLQSKNDQRQPDGSKIFNFPGTILNSLCEARYIMSPGDDGFNKFGKRSVEFIDTLNTPEAINSLGDFVNYANNNLMSRFREQLPCLPDSYYKIAVLTFAGFSTCSISCITKLKEESLRNYRSKIRALINASDYRDRGEFLSYFS